MNELNLSSYVQIMRPGFKTHDGQETAGVFLLSSINDQEYVAERGYRTDNLDSKRISKIVNRKSPVPDELRQASMIQEVIDDTVAYFRRDVANDLNPHLIDDTVNNLITLIRADGTIPETKKNSLLSCHESGDDDRFLAEVFLYALNRPNKKTDDNMQPDDAPLLLEANFECPLCHKKLVEEVKGRAFKRYQITQIFPDDLDESESSEFDAAFPAAPRGNDPANLIALDEECSDRYLLKPTVEECRKLAGIKHMLARSYAAKTAISSLQLEEDIRQVAEALGQISDISQLTQLEYNALRIDEKIAPENFLIRATTQSQVVTFYKYIENIFSESDIDFDTIASEVQISSRKLEKEGLSQAVVISELSEWIRNRAGLSPDHQMACNIVVSFFIQNCEVFHK